MLSRLNLEAFKCFQKLVLSLRPLTILSGLNASGKSSIIQSLAMLHQTIVDHEWSQALLLNGSAIRLGNVDDVVDQEVTETEYKLREFFSIGVSTAGGEALWSAGGVDVKDARSAPLISVKFRTSPEVQFRAEVLRLSAEDETTVPVYRLFPKSFENEGLDAINSIRDILRRLVFISSERIGPRETYERAPDFTERFVGANGEFTASYIERYGEEPCNPGLQLGDRFGSTIREQVNAWMDYFFPGSAVEVTPIEGTGLMKLRIRTNKAGGYHRPQNVGFGLTHILPILVACSGTRSGDLVLIENPETHLHPHGQSEIGGFIGRLVSSGVQVVLETHSDHVLNGIRKRVGSEGLPSGDVAIYFLNSRDEVATLTDQQRVQRLEIDDNGRILHWPVGFFDQIERDLGEIFEK